VQDVLAIFKKHDFGHASVIGHIGDKQSARNRPARRGNAPGSTRLYSRQDPHDPESPE
jgi:hypothetical protein